MCCEPNPADYWGLNRSFVFEYFGQYCSFWSDEPACVQNHGEEETSFPRRELVMHNPLLSSFPRFPRPCDSKSALRTAEHTVTFLSEPAANQSRLDRFMQGKGGYLKSRDLPARDRVLARTVRHHQRLRASVVDRHSGAFFVHCILISHLPLRRESSDEHTEQRHPRKARTNKHHGTCILGVLDHLFSPLTIPLQSRRYDSRTTIFSPEGRPFHRNRKGVN